MLDKKKVRLDKKEVKNLFVAGYIASEIADILKAKVDTVKKCIDRNFKIEEVLSIHKEKRRIKKDIKRVISNTSNRYMGTEQLIKYNRSSFNMNKNGVLVYNNDHGLAPVDLPQRFKPVLG
ncbi:hypothetical protein FDE76_15280 [Clostridium botulinum]|uniref:Uncharacterized protein n=2 Tax=Clostridium botulinum TaxID=1491 RepID=A0A0A0UZ88_CLOBO|nr:hypothetical protein [Clostridium botulinum]ACD14201.1 conserved hypothetical protein [Clostridium botulinum B str. Eklund 17B (NRP)]AIW54482.1 hypothetical protein [Clostridium botulinum]AIW54536.1 hypothetical protein [Clostridium botulinum]MBY6977849.1 hypothetical protein [Clostridium botulinum]MBY7002318.1 hypothetical protein [Clostridium botulinum]